MTNNLIPALINPQQTFSFSAYNRSGTLHNCIDSLEQITITENTEEITQKLFDNPQLANQLNSSLQELTEDEHGNPQISGCISLNAASISALQEIIGPKINAYINHPKTNLIWIDWTKR